MTLPTPVGRPFLTKLNFWTYMAHVVCRKKVSFFSNVKSMQKEYVSQFGIAVPETLLHIGTTSLVRGAFTLPKGNFILKVDSGPVSAPKFIKQGEQELIKNEHFNLSKTLQEVKKFEKAKRGMVESYIFEELLVDEVDKKSPPRSYKFFVMREKILKIYYFRANFGLEKSTIEAACINTDHALCKQTWLRTEFANITIATESVDKPPCWKELLSAASKIGGELDRFAMFTFYATNRGPVFGGFSNNFDEWLWTAACNKDLQETYDRMSPSEKDFMMPDPFIKSASEKAKHFAHNSSYTPLSDLSVALLFTATMLPIFYFH